MNFLPTVDAEIWRRYPEYRALSVVVLGFRGTDSAAPPVHPLQPPVWMMEHLEAWRGAFRAFGANPKKTPCSVEALWKRVERNGSLPAIDPVVDLYNALSIRFGACFVGEDLDRYAGSPRLVVARGDEPFDTVRDGAPVIEHPDSGEIVWRDDARSKAHPTCVELRCKRGSSPAPAKARRPKLLRGFSSLFVGHRPIPTGVDACPTAT
jgi:DNA/RNA-binding domain of Phe-tRNA-synthetase-like protein